MRNHKETGVLRGGVFSLGGREDRILREKSGLK